MPDVTLEFCPGLNIVSGPNEAGKSSIAAAIRMALFRPKRVSRGDPLHPDSQVPWGTSLSPRIELQLATSDRRLRIERELPDGPSRLFRTEGGTETAIADKRIENQLLQEIGWANETALPSVFWVAQGSAGDLLESFKPEKDLMVRLQRSLQNALGGGAAELVQALQTEHKALFDGRKKDRQFKEKAPVPRLRSQRLEETERLQGAEATLADLEELDREHQEVVERRLRLEANLSDSQRKLDEARRRHDEWQTGRVRHQELEHEAAVLQTRLVQVRNRHGQVQSLDAEIRDLENKLEKAAKELEVLEEGIRQTEANCRHLEENRTAAARELLACKRVQEQLKAARELADLQEQSRDLQRRVHEGRALRTTLMTRQEELRTLSVPDSEGMQNLQRLEQRLESSKEATRASRMTLGFRPARTVSIRTTRDLGQPMDRNLNAEEFVEWHANRQIRMEIADVGTLDIRSAAEATSEAGDLEELQASIDRILQKHKVPSVAALQERSERTRQLEGMAKELDGRLKGTLGGALLSELERAIEQNHRRESDLRHRHESLPEFSDQALTQKLSSAEGDLRNCERQLESTDEELGKLREVLEQQRTERANLQARIDENRSALEGRRKERDRVAAQEIPAEISAPESRKKEPGSLEQQMQEAEEAYRQARYGADQARPSSDMLSDEQLQLLKEAAASAGTELDSLRSRQTYLEATLQARSDGAYNKLVESREELSRLESEERQALLDGQAVDLLFQILQQEKERATRDVFTPVKDRVVPWLVRLSAGRYPGLELDRDMRPSTVVPALGGVDEASIRQLSFGTQEQLALLVRLALVDLLSSEERQCLLLDDSLVNTDGTRMAVAREILQEVSRTSQLLVLTCHPEDYQFEDGDVRQITLT